jgi:hypothetical protein
VRLENVWELQEDGNGTRGVQVTYVSICICVFVCKEKEDVFATSHEMQTSIHLIYH